MCSAELGWTAFVLPKDTDCTDAASRPRTGTDHQNCVMPVLDLASMVVSGIMDPCVSMMCNYGVAGEKPLDPWSRDRDPARFSPASCS